MPVHRSVKPACGLRTGCTHGMLCRWSAASGHAERSEVTARSGRRARPGRRAPGRRSPGRRESQAPRPPSCSRAIWGSSWPSVPGCGRGEGNQPSLGRLGALLRAWVAADCAPCEVSAGLAFRSLLIAFRSLWVNFFLVAMATGSQISGAAQDPALRILGALDRAADRRGRDDGKKISV
jgi:hypothetical protein